MTAKNEARDVVIIWLFSEFLFHLFSFACWRMKILLSIFFNCNFDFFLSVMTNKQNAVLFTKKSRCGRVMMNG